MFHPVYNYGHYTSPPTLNMNGKVYWPRGRRGLAGSSSINGLIYIRVGSGRPRPLEARRANKRLELEGSAAPLHQERAITATRACWRIGTYG